MYIPTLTSPGPVAMHMVVQSQLISGLFAAIAQAKGDVTLVLTACPSNDHLSDVLQDL